MTKNLLLEIGTEELPSSCIDEGIKNLKTILQDKLQESRLDFLSLETYGTPRRITAFVSSLAEKQASYEKIITGPPKSISLDSNGNYSSAAYGFAKSMKVSVQELEEFETEKGVYLGIKVVEEGKNTLEILPDLLKSSILSINFSKQMTWGNFSVRFARPIRWITAIYGEDVVKFNIENIESSNKTCRHRVVGAGMIEVPVPLNSVESYLKFLRSDCLVMLDPQERKELILSLIKKIEDEHWKRKYSVVIDEGLLKEVINLVEFPNVLEGTFPDEYLYLPKDILIKAIQHHQRYFAVVDANQNPVTKFIIIQNGLEDKTGEIVKGNERVLKARLNDATYFYNEDRKENFDTWLERLKGVIFYSGLGSLYDKSLRLSKICSFIKDLLENEGIQFVTGQVQNKKSLLMEGSIKDKLKRASILCKCDLVTNLVVEFPELQGLVGRQYAIEKNEPEDVANGIFEHYLPRFAGDILPETDVGAILSIADKADTIAGMFLMGNIPTGSEDPFALRRKATGIILTALKKSYNIDILKISEFCINLYFEQANFKDNNIKNSVIKVDDKPKNIEEMANFISARYRFRLEKQNKRTDIFDAIVEVGCWSIVDLDLRYKAIEEYILKEKIERLSEPLIRCKNIVKGKTFTELKEELLVDETEVKLFKKTTMLESNVKKYIKDKRHYDAILLLADFRSFINEFFDKVLVMDENRSLRQNRINLVKKCVNLYYLIADFSKISSC